MKLPSWLSYIWSWICFGIVVASVALIVGGLSWLSWCYWWDCSCREWLVTGSDCRESGSTTLRNLGFVAGGLLAIGFAIWRGLVADRQSKASRDQAATSRRSLLNERYQRGAEMLGSPVLGVRLGGIYALEQLAEDEPELYHVPIVRLLSTFARDPNKKEDKRIDEVEGGGQLVTKLPCEDVHEAVRAIGNRCTTDIERENKARFAINLAGVNLNLASLSGANLSSVILHSVNLTSASVGLANLTGANLGSANLRDTILTDTNLSGANLSRVRNLTQDQLDKACADPANPPNLENANDVRTGDPLVWNERPCSFSVER